MIPKHGRQAGVIVDRRKDRGIQDTLQGQISRPNVGKESEANPRPGRKRQPDVFCWCQRQMIRSTWERIKAGLGETCGHISCKDPANRQGATTQS